MIGTIPSADKSDARALPAVILAGGASRRMGQDKAHLPLNGQPLLDHVYHRLAKQCAPVVISGPQDRFIKNQTVIVADGVSGFAGPLAGILAALEHFSMKETTATHLLSVAVDTPFFPENLALCLEEEAGTPESLVIARSENRTHPVFALWPFQLKQDLAQWLKVPENRRMMDFINRHSPIFVDFSIEKTSAGALDPFFNINTPDDLARARRFAVALSTA
ncbi:molybdenum cofactor guanylyltransferase MobA [Martelella mediterranea]|uniref:Molybdenum cofactor guanylyltransferase n=1 Tax=Martelella mediterranea TaxID=293089 RepID=A0A4R3NXF5_9HYPH|nr:molybdenum cofactor guanylyltransferase MobA [Martelella mediterranea]TCT38816.1 molybdenum cofactor guanylyltransferase [Martelella mediterranea]